jgi:hypothetical protein
MFITICECYSISSLSDVCSSRTLCTTAACRTTVLLGIYTRATLQYYRIQTLNEIGVKLKSQFEGFTVKNYEVSYIFGLVRKYCYLGIGD